MLLLSSVSVSWAFDFARQLSRTTFDSLVLDGSVYPPLALMRSYISVKSRSASLVLGLEVIRNASSFQCALLAFILTIISGPFRAQPTLQSMNNSHRSNRPLVFSNRADIHTFVMGNNSQALSMNVPIVPPRISIASPVSSLFDRYYRNGLMLKDCDQRDLQTLGRNLVMSQQPLSSNLAEEIAAKASQNQRKNMAMTNFHFDNHQPAPSDPLLQTAPMPTREYQQNEVLFNYHEMGQAKKKQKNNFLSQIEARIAEAEKQMGLIEQLQEQEKVQFQDLRTFQGRVGEQLTKNVQIGKIRQKIQSATGLQEAFSPRLISVHQEMEVREIGEVLQQHIKVNEDLIERAENIKRKSLDKFNKSIEKRNDKMENTKNSLGSTMRRPLGQQKSMMSTMRMSNKPPLGKGKK